MSYGAAGLIRSLAVGRDGSQLAVGHSSGYISNYFVNTSLDQTASGWKWEDGRLAANLCAPPGPLHCVCPHGREVIMGSTANRLTIQQGVEKNSPGQVEK